jgi:hypothetical protein
LCKYKVQSWAAGLTGRSAKNGGVGGGGARCGSCIRELMLIQGRRGARLGNSNKGELGRELFPASREGVGVDICIDLNYIVRLFVPRCTLGTQNINRSEL